MTIDTFADLCIIKNKVLMIRSIMRRFGATQWHYTNALGQNAVLEHEVIEGFVAQKWCKAVQLDATYQYLSITRAGREVVTDYLYKLFHPEAK